MTSNLYGVKARKIILECEHILWLKPPMPSPGDHLYCRPCGSYQQVGPTARGGRTYEDEWSWVKVGHGYEGRCEHCLDTFQSRNWYRLRDTMDGHHLRKHVNSSLIFGDPRPIPPPLPTKRNDPPPF